MQISATEWGKYNVDNQVVEIKDIAVISGVLTKWTERKEFEEITGKWHVLCPEMVERAIAEKPDVLIIGNGHVGALKCPDDVLNIIRESVAEVYVLHTPEACTKYSELVSIGKQRVALVAHGTC